MQRFRAGLRRAVDPALALFTALLLGAILIVLTDVEHLRQLGSDPVAAIGGAVSSVVKGYASMFSGAIGDPARIATALRTGQAEDIAAAVRPISETMLSATPLIFAGLGVAVSFSAGLFNLGVDGQFLIGGVGAMITATLVAGHLPPPIALAAALVAGTLAGGAYAFVPGFLKARTGAHEVITTLMFNGIAPNLAFLTFAFVRLAGPAAPVAAVPRLLGLRTIRVDAGFVVALVMAAAVSVLLWRTTTGFELRASGLSRAAARAAGIRPGRAMVLAMSLSGALVGMGSAFYALGPALGTGGDAPMSLGSVAIVLALLAGRRPAGVVVAALLYGALTTGAKTMVTTTGIPLAILMVVVTFAITFVSAPGLARWIWRRSPRRAGDAGATAVPAAGESSG